MECCEGHQRRVCHEDLISHGFLKVTEISILGFDVKNVIKVTYMYFLPSQPSIIQVINEPCDQRSTGLESTINDDTQKSL